MGKFIIALQMRTVDQRKYTKEYFTQNCEGHEDWQGYGVTKLSPRLAETFRLVKIKKGMRIVDFGSGRGELAYQVALGGAEVVGLDYSKVAIKLAEKIKRPKTGKLTFKLLTGHTLPFKDHSQDLIFFVDVIEHLYPEEVAAILSEFKRVLVRGGRVIMHTAPNKDYYDFGYKYFTRYANIFVNLFLWPVFFSERLIDGKNPRTVYEKAVHVNECSSRMVADYFKDAGFKTNVWLSSEFRKIRVRDKIRYTFLQPQFWILKRWFAYDIWAIAKA